MNWELIAGLRPARQIVDEVAARLRRETKRDVRVASRVRLVTEEGEYAALAVLDVGGRSAVAVAVVFGDDHHAIAVGDAGALSASEVRAVRLGWERRRRRRFLYAAPAGWRAAPGAGQGTVWHRGESMIVVHASIPTGDGLDARAVSAFLARQTTFPVTSHPAKAIRNPRGLAGTTLDLDGANGLVAQVVVFEDAQCTYPLRLETTTREYLPSWQAFAGLIDSIVPLPFPATSSGTMTQWAD